MIVQLEARKTESLAYEKASADAFFYVQKKKHILMVVKSILLAKYQFEEISWPYEQITAWCECYEAITLGTSCKVTVQ